MLLSSVVKKGCDLTIGLQPGVPAALLGVVLMYAFRGPLDSVLHGQPLLLTLDPSPDIQTHLLIWLVLPLSDLMSSCNIYTTRFLMVVLTQTLVPTYW